MEYTIQLPATFTQKDLRTLLEKDWLVPRKVRHFLRTRRNVRKNGKPILFHEIVQGGDNITLIFEEDDFPTPDILLGEAALVQVLFEDEHLIVLDKPAGVKTHPNQPDEKDTLLNHLAAYLAPKQETPYVLHRLDKETSGVILFAKNPFVLPILGRMLEAREIHRHYQAIIEGVLPKTQLTISKKIGRHRHDRRKRVVDEKNGQPAITHVTVVSEAPNKKQSHILCQLETGRTHQIRVHLASIKHPILGDPLYQIKEGTDSRLMLHAYQLDFVHPFTEKKLVIQSQHPLFPMK